MRRALLAVWLLAGCNEPLEGPQPDQKIQPKQIEGPPPSHRPIVNPDKAIAPAPNLEAPPVEAPKAAEPVPEAEPEKKAPAPVKKKPAAKKR